MTASELRQSRVAIVGYFFVLGVATATWAARLPAIKESLHLSDGRLGLALFAVPAGSVLTLALSGRIADRFGAVRVLRVAGVLDPAALIPIGLARNLVALMATLAVYGAMAGLLDVSMNAPSTCTSTSARRPGWRRWRSARSRSRWRLADWPVTAWRPGSARCGWCGPAAWWPASGWQPAC